MSDPTPSLRYQRATTHILLHIQQRQLKPGDRLPSERWFAEDSDCGRPTVNKAIACLIAEGRLRREGYKLYVASPPLSEASRTLIAVLCPHPLHQKQRISHNMVEAAHDVCMMAKARFMPLLSVNGDQQRAQLIELLREDIDGIAIWPHSKTDYTDIFRQLKARRLPLVVNDLDFGVGDFVGVDNAKGIQTIVRHLHDLGHREIAYFTRAINNLNLVERRESYGYEAYRLFKGNSRRRIYELPGELDAGLPELFARLRREAPGVTAVCCSNDVIAIDLMAHCQRLKIKVPGDLSIAGFDGIDVREESSPALTTVAQDFYQMGALAVDLLIRRCRMRQLKHASVLQQIRVAPRLMVRDSTGAP